MISSVRSWGSCRSMEYFSAYFCEEIRSMNYAPGTKPSNVKKWNAPHIPKSSTKGRRLSVPTEWISPTQRPMSSTTWVFKSENYFNFDNSKRSSLMNFHFFLQCPQLGFRLWSGIHQIYQSFQSINRNVNETELSVDPWLHSTSLLLVLFVFQEPHLILIHELIMVSRTLSWRCQSS